MIYLGYFPRLHIFDLMAIKQSFCQNYKFPQLTKSADNTWKVIRKLGFTFFLEKSGFLSNLCSRLTQSNEPLFGSFLQLILTLWQFAIYNMILLSIHGIRFFCQKWIACRYKCLWNDLTFYDVNSVLFFLYCFFQLYSWKEIFLLTTAMVKDFIVRISFLLAHNQSFYSKNERMYV